MASRKYTISDMDHDSDISKTKPALRDLMQKCQLLISRYLEFYQIPFCHVRFSEDITRYDDCLRKLFITNFRSKSNLIRK